MLATYWQAVDVQNNSFKTVKTFTEQESSSYNLSVHGASQWSYNAWSPCNNFSIRHAQLLSPPNNFLSKLRLLYATPLSEMTYLSSILQCFYRAMHFSAYARYWDRMSSVCLSVTLVDCDHISWKSWKLIARTITPTPSLFVAKRRSTYSQGNMEKFGGD